MASNPKLNLSDHPVVVIIGVIAAIATICSFCIIGYPFLISIFSPPAATQIPPSAIATDLPSTETNETPPPPTDTQITDTEMAPPTSTDTPPGTILEIGKSWKQDGLELQLVEKEFYCVECGWMTLSFKLTNLGFQERVVTYSLENFTAVDNQGRHINVGAVGNWTFTQDCPKNTVVLPSQDVVYLSAGTCQLPDNFTWSIGETMAMELNLSDQSLQEVIVNVSGISSINGAQWRISIDH